MYRFPSQYFAVLYGISMIAAGVFSLFQYALFSWAEAYLQAPFHVSSKNHYQYQSYKFIL